MHSNGCCRFCSAIITPQVRLYKWEEGELLAECSYTNTILALFLKCMGDFILVSSTIYRYIQSTLLVFICCIRIHHTFTCIGIHVVLIGHVGMSGNICLTSWYLPNSVTKFQISFVCVQSSFMMFCTTRWVYSHLATVLSLCICLVTVCIYMYM